MSTAVDEIGEYVIGTRFSKKKRIYIDPKIPRPVSRADLLQQIEEAYQESDWKEPEAKDQARRLGLEYKNLDDYTDEELKRNWLDLVKHGQILLEV